MRFKSESQRKAMFANMNRMSDEPRKIQFKQANVIKFQTAPKESSVIKVKDLKDDIKFSEEYDDKPTVAVKRYGKEMMTVPVKRGGRDRDVYLLDEGKVLKVAKSPEGLVQNSYEGDSYLELVPEVYEKGADFVVAERADRNDPKSMKLLKPLKSYTQDDFLKRTSPLQAELNKIDEEYGTDMYNVLNYSPAVGDFTSPRNWGWKEDMPKIIDPASLSVEAIRVVERTSPIKRDWQQVLSDRRRVRRELGLDSRFSELDNIEYYKKRNRDNSVLVDVDIGKFDANWKKDPESYVGLNGEGGIGNRYNNVKEFLSTVKEPVEAPEVDRMKSIDVVSFTDGRHRVAALRDLGAKRTTLLVPKRDKQWFEDNFGI
jgi:hypothetical protein